MAQKLNSKIVFLTARPDVVIEPYTENIGSFQFERIDEAIQAGEEAMEKMMPKLLKVIEQKKKEKAQEQDVKAEQKEAKPERQKKSK